MTRVSGSQGIWVETASGARVNLLAPAPTDIRIADLARALSRLARFPGYAVGEESYSIAQHAVWMALTLEREFYPDRDLALLGLLSDAPSAYLGALAPAVRTLLAPCSTPRNADCGSPSSPRPVSASRPPVSVARSRS